MGTDVSGRSNFNLPRHTPVFLLERQQRFDIFERVRFGHFGKDLSQVAIRFNAIGLGCFDQAVKISAGVRAGHTVAEKEVFSAYHKGPNRVFSHVVVDAQTPIKSVGREFRPLLVSIVHRFAQRRLWRHHQ